MMLESKIEEKVQKFAEERGWLVRKLKWIGRRAAPDRFYARTGRIVLVEFKQAGKKPDPLQEREHKRLREHGVEVVVIDSIDQGMAFFE